MRVIAGIEGQASIGPEYNDTESLISYQCGTNAPMISEEGRPTNTLVVTLVYFGAVTAVLERALGATPRNRIDVPGET